MILTFIFVFSFITAVIVPCSFPDSKNLIWCLFSASQTSGGVMSVADYNEKIACGADLVQIYTGFIFEGPRLIHDILFEGIS